MRFYCGLFFWLLCLGKILGQSPSDLEYQGDQASVTGDWPMAYTYYWESYQKDSLSFERKFKLALAAMHCYEDRISIRLFQELFRADQGKIHPESQYYLGKLYQRRGDYAMAEQTWKKCKKKINKISPEVVTKQGLESDIQEVIWAQLQNKNEALEVLPYPWNGPLSESQPYWNLDTLFFQQWDKKEWLLKMTTGTMDSIIRGKEDWEGHSVIQIRRLDGHQMGTGLSSFNKQIILQKEGNHWKPLPAVNAENCRSSMPCLARIDGVLTLFFASDRVGGLGGWDIWFSQWQDAWSKPVNLGITINTPEDEVAPNYFESTLYFSSKGQKGFGELDIYRSQGKPGYWTQVENLGMPINSPKNDMGIDVKNHGEQRDWVISSARHNDGCCLDIFHWKEQLKMDSILVPDSTDIWVKTIQQWLPISLYFHNDEPDPKSTESTTKWTYTDCWNSYQAKSVEYIKVLESQAEWDEFEEQYLAIPYQKLQRALPLIMKSLGKGDSLVLQVRGFASPLAASDYNEKLTGRRISCLKNELANYNNGVLSPYLDSGRLKVQSLPFGERKAAKGVSDEVVNKKASIYSKEAREERRIEILGIVVN